MVSWIDRREVWIFSGRVVSILSHNNLVLSDIEEEMDAISVTFSPTVLTLSENVLELLVRVLIFKFMESYVPSMFSKERQILSNMSMGIEVGIVVLLFFLVAMA